MEAPSSPFAEGCYAIQSLYLLPLFSEKSIRYHSLSESDPCLLFRNFSRAGNKNNNVANFVVGPHKV